MAETKKKRLLVVTQHYWPETFRITDIVEGLAAHGAEVDVLCGLPNYPKGEWFPGYSARGPFAEEHGGARLVRCREIPRKGNTGLRIFLNYCSWPLAALWGLGRLRGGYDAVFCYNTSPVLMCLPALAAGRRFGAPVTVYVLDLWPENLYSVLPVKNRALRWLAKTVSDACYKRADRLIAMSEALGERLQARTGKGKAEVAVIPQYCEDFYAAPGFDPALRELAPDGFLLLFAGNFSPAQSLDTAILALEQANRQLLAQGHPPCHLVLVGDGMSRPALEALVQERALGAHVHFFGSVPPQRVPALNGAADALLVSLSASPDLGLTVPAKVASCMAAAKPLLASMDGEGARAVMQGGGLVSAAEDAAALAENLVRLVQLPEAERLELGRASRRWYEAHYRREALLRQIEDFIFESRGGSSPCGHSY